MLTKKYIQLDQLQPGDSASPEGAGPKGSAPKGCEVPPKEAGPKVSLGLWAKLTNWAQPGEADQLGEARRLGFSQRSRWPCATPLAGAGPFGSRAKLTNLIS